MRLLISALLLLLFSCQPTFSDYKQFGSNYSFKLLQLGDGEKPAQEQFVFAYLLITDLQKDTIHFVPDYPYFFALANDTISKIILKHRIGDSLLIKTAMNRLVSKFDFYQLSTSKADSVLLHIKLLNSFSQENAEEEKAKVLSLLELKEQAKLKKHISACNGELEYIDGIYREILKKTDGEIIRKGSKVSLHYRGKFLNGYVFDDSYSKGVAPSFTFGREFQLLEGMQIGLKGLKEGEEVKLILPSRLAFKEKGSLAGIVPPYTAVIFEINIIKVIN